MHFRSLWIIFFLLIIIKPICDFAFWKRFGNLSYCEVHLDKFSFLYFGSSPKAIFLYFSFEILQKWLPEHKNTMTNLWFTVSISHSLLWPAQSYLTRLCYSGFKDAEIWHHCRHLSSAVWKLVSNSPVFNPSLYIPFNSSQ